MANQLFTKQSQTFSRNNARSDRDELQEVLAEAALHDPQDGDRLQGHAARGVGGACEDLRP